MFWGLDQLLNLQFRMSVVIIFQGFHWLCVNHHLTSTCLDASTTLNPPLFMIFYIINPWFSRFSPKSRNLRTQLPSDRDVAKLPLGSPRGYGQAGIQRHQRHLERFVAPAIGVAASVFSASGSRDSPSGWWLSHPSQKIWVRRMGFIGWWLFPTEWENKKMFQTTNWPYYHIFMD